MCSSVLGREKAERFETRLVKGGGILCQSGNVRKEEGKMLQQLLNSRLDQVDPSRKTTLPQTYLRHPQATSQAHMSEKV